MWKVALQPLYTVHVSFIGARERKIYQQMDNIAKLNQNKNVTMFGNCDGENFNQCYLYILVKVKMHKLRIYILKMKFVQIKILASFTYFS